MDVGRAGRRRVAAFVAAVTILGLLAILMDRREVAIAFERARAWPVPIALLFTALSYTALGYGFAFVSDLFGIRLPRNDLALVGFVSSVITNLVSLGGVAGYSLRLMVLSRRGLSSAEILGPSIFHSYLNNLFLTAMLPVGLAVLVVRHALQGTVEVELVAAAAILMLVFAAATVALVGPSFRRVLLALAERIWKRVSGRALGKSIFDLDEILTRGIAAARRRPGALIGPAALVVLDWASCATAMWFCFETMGGRVGPGVLVVGFTVGVAAGLVSMIPGGLGVQEGSMAGVYALLGVRFEQALLASIVFRVVYYFIPYLVSLVLYRRLFGGR